MWNKSVFAVSTVAFLGCAGPERNTLDTHEVLGAAAQALTPDEDCTELVAGAAAREFLYAAVMYGPSSGSVELPTGDHVVVTSPDGIRVDWTSSYPIDLVLLNGDPRVATARYATAVGGSFFGGSGLIPPRDSALGGLQLPFYSVTFCFRLSPSDVDRLEDSGAPKPPPEPPKDPGEAADGGTPPSPSAMTCSQPFSSSPYGGTPEVNDERLSSSNPLQTGRLWFTPAASPNMFVVVGADKQFRYTAHTFRNWTNCEQWVRVTEIAKVSTPRPEDPVVGEFGVGANQSVVYLDAFDPNDVAKNYLAGRNRAGGPGLHSYAFKVPPQRDFVVVESRAAPHEGSDVLPRFDPTIDLYVSGCGEPGSECSTASPTAPSQPTNPTDSSSPTNRSDTSSANPPAASSAANPPAAFSPATHTEGTDGTSAPQPGVTSSDSADIQEGAGAACTMSSHKARFGGAGFALVAVAAAAFRRRRSR